MKIIHFIHLNRKYLVKGIFIFAFLLVANILFSKLSIGAGTQLLIDQIGQTGSQTFNVPFATNTVSFNYTGGTMTFTSCPDKACSWAIDDAAKLIVTRPDGTQVSRDFISDTVNKPAEVVTTMFQPGVNAVTIQIIDRFGPFRGLSQPLYLVESTTALPVAKPQVKNIPLSLLYANHPFVLHSKDPVNSFTGSFTLKHTDMTIQGSGPAPVISRSYDSSNNFAGPLGVGWVHNYAMQLVSPDATTSDIVLIEPNGRADRLPLTKEIMRHRQVFI